MRNIKREIAREAGAMTYHEGGSLALDMTIFDGKTNQEAFRQGFLGAWRRALRAARLDGSPKPNLCPADMLLLGISQHDALGR